MDHMIDVETSQGVPFRVVYGPRKSLLSDELLHQGRPIVSFYDRRYDFTEHGQFVSDYELSKILTHTKGVGLDLYGGEPNWVVDGSTLGLIEAWLRNIR